MYRIARTRANACSPEGSRAGEVRVSWIGITQSQTIDIKSASF